MQVSRFNVPNPKPTDAAIVAHKLSIGGYVGTFSAWFNAAGNLIDAEHCYWQGTRRIARSVKPNGPAWQALQRRYPSVSAIAPGENPQP